MEFHVEDHPDPLDIEFLETQIRREASAAMGLGDEVELAIFVRDAGTVVAGISGWTWGDCCELQSLWVEPSLRGRGLATRLLAAAEAEAAARGCSQTVHFTYDFQARALYERNGYELVGRVEDFPSGTDVLWYRKRLKGRSGHALKNRAHADQEPARPDVRGVRGTPDDDLRPRSHRGLPACDRRGGAPRRHRARRRGGKRHPERVRGAGGCCARLRGGADDGRRPGAGVGRRERRRGHRPGDPRRRRWTSSCRNVSM